MNASRSNLPTANRLRAALLHGAVAAVLAGAVVVAFAPALHGEFLNWDDDRNFTQNTEFTGLSADYLHWAWETYHLGVWQPLSWLLLAAQYEINGLDASVFHAFSLALHALNSILLYAVIRAILQRVGATPNDDRQATTSHATLAESRSIHAPGPIDVAAGLSALLFAVHPLRVEAVAWISCQPYLPATSFVLLGTWVYLRGQHRASVAHPNLATLLATFLCFVVAVMFKAVAVTLPVMLLLLDVYPLQRIRLPGRVGIRPLLEKLPFLAVAACISVWAAEAKDYSETRVPFATSDPGARLAQAAAGVVFYLQKTAVPTNLSPYYRIPEDLGISRFPYLAMALGIIVVTAGLLIASRRRPGPLIAWLAYVVILVPNLGLVQISQQIATDRYSYLAVMPLMPLLAAGIHGAWSRLATGNARCGWIAPMACAAVAVALTVHTRQQSRIWQSSTALWRTALAVDPRCAEAYCQLGHALFQAAAGDAGKYKQAADHFERAIALAPTFSFAYSNLGTTLLMQGDFERATTILEEAVDLGRRTNMPALDLAKTHYALAVAQLGRRNMEAARLHADSALSLGYEPAAIMLRDLGEDN